MNGQGRELSIHKEGADGKWRLTVAAILTVEACQTQCYNQYRAYYNYYCGWGRICGNITNYLQQFYTNCRNNCSEYLTN